VVARGTAQRKQETKIRNRILSPGSMLPMWPEKEKSVSIDWDFVLQPTQLAFIQDLKTTLLFY
jgi:hypothetical protein